MVNNMDMFSMIDEQNKIENSPLAERMKPNSLEQFVGQEEILKPGKLLYRLIESGQMSSLIFHGPPGTGKTSLAKIIANSTNSEFQTVNAVTAGIKDLRKVFEIATSNLNVYKKKTILFIDEIHRFNKSQQDALLPYVEKGTVILIGATTENPYYEVNNALISRSMIFKLKKLKADSILQIINNALETDEYLKDTNISVSADVRKYIADISNGDARRGLNILEMVAISKDSYLEEKEITIEDVNNCVQHRVINHDKDGNNHYDVISAFIKSMRGSDPDAALHYLARLIHGGEDPKFIARRIVILASEDIGNADPQALVVANNAFDAINKIGMPEGRIILAQAVTYMATAPKSNAAYVGIDKALRDVKSSEIGDIPYYLRDATSSRIERKKNPEYANKENYKYPHNYEGNYVEQRYLPEKLRHTAYYKPSRNGYEKIITKRMSELKE